MPETTLYLSEKEAAVVDKMCDEAEVGIGTVYRAIVYLLEEDETVRSKVLQAASSEKRLPSRGRGFTAEYDDEDYQNMLEETEGNIAEAATRLGVSRNAFYQRLQRDLISRPEATGTGESADEDD